MRWIVLYVLLFHGFCSFGQERNAELDSLRKIEEGGGDSVIFTSGYIRYTTRSLLKDSTQTLPIDTTLRGFHL
jgi:hypothetical protein